MDSYKTEQEKFWAGKFGSEYINRNQGAKMIANSLVLFSAVLSKREKINSTIEFGANIGLNQIALKTLLPDIEQSAVEINKDAAQELNALGFVKVYQESMLDFKVDYQRDFSFTSGVLIHIAPEMIKTAYEALYQSSKKYICVAEYYNPSPVEIDYRGYTGKLFKRDFAGDMLKIYDDLVLVDHGFTYHNDANFIHDDINWFLLKKRD